jgi:predicted ABC-type sugar transport system permease subunit
MTDAQFWKVSWLVVIALTGIFIIIEAVFNHEKQTKSGSGKYAIDSIRVGGLVRRSKSTD